MATTHYRIASLEDLYQCAQELLLMIGHIKNQSSAVVVMLSGDLGAGKTALVQMIARILGVTDRVQSPTFVILKQYQLPQNNYSFTKLVHIDAYRLEGENLEPFHFPKVFADNQSVVCIEWPQYIESVLPGGGIAVHIEQDISGIRMVSVHSR